MLREGKPQQKSYPTGDKHTISTFVDQTHIRTGKAPGPDSIPPEATKTGIKTSTEILHELFEQIWEEDVPQLWKDGHLMKLPKKGNLKKCKNHGGIMLLSVPGKVLNRIILDELNTTLDAELRDQHAGLRKNTSCTDHIATLRILVEQTLKWNS